MAMFMEDDIGDEGIIEHNYEAETAAVQKKE